MSHKVNITYILHGITPIFAVPLGLISSYLINLLLLTIYIKNSIIYCDTEVITYKKNFL